MSPDERAARLAERQDGLLFIDDVTACGLSVDQRLGRVEGGRWERLVDGVYRMPGSPRTWRQDVRAAAMAVRRAGGVTSFASSRALHGLGTASVLPHVTVPPGRSARCRIAKVHRSPVHPADVCMVDGIRTTTVSRMIVDMASVLDRPALEELVDDAICQGKASPASVLASLARAGGHRRGRVLLRSVLEVWTRGIEPGSQAEVRLFRRLADWGIDAPVSQHEVRAPDGTFVARVDAAWPDRRVALEYEGVRHHAARAVDHDEARYERLRDLGWTVVTADKLDVLPGARRLPDLLGRLLARRAA